MTKEEIIQKYEPLIEEASLVFTEAKNNLDAIFAERDAKITQVEEYQRALEQKAEAEEVLLRGLPK